METINDLTFNELTTSVAIQVAVKEMGFTKPSEIQAQGIPHILTGVDLIAQAPTGSGKTAAFAIPVLEKIDVNNPEIQAIIMCPTRELTVQVHREFEKLAKYMDDVRVVSVYGGQQIERQFAVLNKNPQIIVATPGRLMDHIRRGSINLEKIKMVVLDEADEMLDMGFRGDIETILTDTPKERQTIMFSATMAKDIIELTKKFQKHPIIVDVTNHLQSAPDIDQFYFEATDKEKPDLITRLLELHNLKLVLIFCNTKSNVDKLVETLKIRGLFADALHGDMGQNQREKVMRGFKTGSVKVLIATDVAGRGIDVKNIQAVFNYDLPRDDEDYIHRIGRTGRAGESGMAFSFITKKQINSLKRIERSNGLQIVRKERPTMQEIEDSRFNLFLNEIKTTIENDDLEKYREKINLMVGENIEMIDIAAALYRLSTKKERMKLKKTDMEEATVEPTSDRPRRDRNRNDRNDRGGDRGGRFSNDRGDRPKRNDRTDRSGNYSGKRGNVIDNKEQIDNFVDDVTIDLGELFGKKPQDGEKRPERDNKKPEKWGDKKKSFGGNAHGKNRGQGKDRAHSKPGGDKNRKPFKKRDKE